MQSMRLTAPVLSTCIKLWVWFARRAHWIVIGSAWMDWWPTVQSHLMALHEHCQSQQGHVQFARYFEVSCSSLEEVIKESHIHTICSPYFTMRFRWALEGQTLNDIKCITVNAFQCHIGAEVWCNRDHGVSSSSQRQASSSRDFRKSSTWPGPDQDLT